MQRHTLSDEVIDFEVENGKIPPVVGIEDKLTDPITKEVVEAANNASEIQLWYDQYLPPAVSTAHLDGLQEVFGLTMTPQEAQESMQKAMDDYLATKAGIKIKKGSCPVDCSLSLTKGIRHKRNKRRVSK